LLAILCLAVCAAAGADGLHDSGYGDGSLVDGQGYTYFPQPDGSFQDAYSHSYSPDALGTYTDALGNVLEVPNTQITKDSDSPSYRRGPSAPEDGSESPYQDSAESLDVSHGDTPIRPHDAPRDHDRRDPKAAMAEGTDDIATKDSELGDDSHGPRSADKLGSMYLQDAGAPYLDTESVTERPSSPGDAAPRHREGPDPRTRDAMRKLQAFAASRGGVVQGRYGDSALAIPDGRANPDATPTIDQVWRERNRDIPIQMRGQ